MKLAFLGKVLPSLNLSPRVQGKLIQYQRPQARLVELCSQRRKGEKQNRLPRSMAKSLGKLCQ